MQSGTPIPPAPLGVTANCPLRFRSRDRGRDGFSRDCIHRHSVFDHRL